MKWFSIVFLLVALFTACGDDYDDTELRERVAALEEQMKMLQELCEELNTNVSSLQTLVNALQENDCVTNVAPVTRGDEIVGYTISFQKAEPITIYNGEDGESYKPVIGVRQDADGVYYWTLDGEWLTDEATGEKVKANGEDGMPGTTPELKIEEGYWHVSYDGGTTWTRLDKATSGTGESIFESVTEDEDFVYITLTDGSVIKLPKEDGSGDDSSLITFADPLVKEICVEHFDANGDGEISMAEAAAVDLSRAGNPFTKTDITSFDELRYFTGSYVIPGYFCDSCIYLESIVLPENLVHIGSECFRATSLKSIQIPNGITEIFSYMFTDCKELQTVILPNKLVEIQWNAFENCVSLTSIELPGTLTKIGESTFENCTSLTTIYCKAVEPPTLDGRGNWFKGAEDATLYVPVGSREKYLAAEGWKDFAVIEETSFE